MKLKHLGYGILFILALIGIVALCYAGYISIYNDGYTKGYDEGGNYIVRYQTNNNKIFLFNQTGSPLELNYNQLCQLVAQSNG